MRADIVYRAADSVIISAAKRGCFEASGIRDTRRIRVTMIMVESVVVPTDKAYVVTCTALPMLTEIQPGYTWRAKFAMPVAKSAHQETSSLEYMDQPMEATFNMNGVTAALQLQLQMIQHRQT
jgi:hypothetical protein